jgi:flagellar P-ring protein precursor FlgI
MIRRTALVTLVASCLALPAVAQSRVGDFTTHAGDVPVRLVGYGLVVGLDGTGDRSFGTTSGAVQTVRSVTNLLRRFNIEIPDDRLRLRNVAAVLVTAEVSPYLRPGGRFEVQVASMGDATSLKGGVLWITPLTSSFDAPPIASAQGALPISLDERTGRWGQTRGNGSARISDAGVLEMAMPPGAPPTGQLLMRTPDLGVAARIAAAINTARGAGSATVQDAGSLSLKLNTAAPDSVETVLAAIDTLPVNIPAASRIVIDAHSGVVVAGGDVKVSNSVVTIRGITVRIGDTATTANLPGVVTLAQGASVRDVAAGLQALGALPGEVAAVFDGLKAAGAIAAAVIIR